MKDLHYLLIGGDKRQEYLYNIFKNKNIKVEKIFLDNSENQSEAYKKISDSEVIILPIPLTKDGENLFAPNFDQKVALTSVIEKITENTIVFSGGENYKFKNLNAKKFINLLNIESLTLNNAMATAEATLKIIIENTTKTIFGSKILVFGFGRIAKILTNYLESLKAKVTVCARKNSALTEAKLLGADVLKIDNFSQHINDFDTIINTIPFCILGAKELEKVNKNSLIIDLASKPGGVDFECAKKLRLNTVHALALPGKYSPESAAEFIEQAIYDEIT